MWHVLKSINMRIRNMSPLPLLLLFLVPSLSQDTAHQDTLPVKGHQQPQGHHVKAMMSRLEQRLNHKIQQAEKRMLWKLQDKVKRLNFSDEIDWLEGIFEFHEKEFEVFQEQSSKQKRLVEELQRKASRDEDVIVRQNRQITKMSNEMRSLQLMVHNLTSLVENLMQISSKGISIPDNIPTLHPGTENGLPLPTAKPGKHYPSDCEEVYLHGGMKYPGNYFILLQPMGEESPFRAKCHITDDAGWTVIQHRQDGTVDFFRGWKDYKWGFGDLEGEFWAGLEHVHHITNQDDNRLRIEMKTFDGEEYWAEYEHFRVSDERDNYRLHIHGYKGNSGDSLTSRWNNHDGLAFSTKDHDNDHRFYDNCAEKFYGAWWFKSCYDSHLNGKYYHKGEHEDYFQRNGILWNTIHDHASLKEVTMMIRRNDNVVEKRSASSNSIN